MNAEEGVGGVLGDEAQKSGFEVEGEEDIADVDEGCFWAHDFLENVGLLNGERGKNCPDCSREWGNRNPDSYHSSLEVESTRLRMKLAAVSEAWGQACLVRRRFC